MSTSKKMTVQGSEISVAFIHEQDYICLTDMVKNFEGSKSLIGNWVTSKNTIEFLGLWEQMNNPKFKLLEFQEFRSRAGSHSFTMSPQRWIETTAAIGIISKSGRYGGTYAHKDIAFEFGSWLSPEFKLLLITEFQRLKEEEKEGLAWNVRRMLTKINYKLHTAAVKDILIPKSDVPKGKEGLLYADEAELLNFALFGYMSKDWREKNPEAVLRGENMRDYASIAELTVLSNLESLNSTYIHEGMNKAERYSKLKSVAQQQMKGLTEGSKQLQELEKRAGKDSPTMKKFNIDL